MKKKTGNLLASLIALIAWTTMGGLIGFATGYVVYVKQTAIFQSSGTLNITSLDADLLRVIFTMLTRPNQFRGVARTCRTFRDATNEQLWRARCMRRFPTCAALPGMQSASTDWLRLYKRRSGIPVQHIMPSWKWDDFSLVVELSKPHGATCMKPCDKETRLRESATPKLLCSAGCHKTAAISS